MGFGKYLINKFCEAIKPSPSFFFQLLKEIKPKPQQMQQDSIAKNLQAMLLPKSLFRLPTRRY